MKLYKALSILALAAMVLSACSSPAATTAAPTIAAPTMAPTTPPPAPTNTSAPPPTAVPPTPTTAAPTPVATLPQGSLVRNGYLLICSDFPYPPQEFYDENGNPLGTDVDLGNEIGARLGLKVEWVNSVFDTIIAAVTAGKCDILISAMNVTADRQKQVSMIPYFQAGQSFVVKKGNPHNVKDKMELCGQPVAAESGTTEAAYLQGEGDYKGKGLTDQCKAAGKAAPQVVVTQKDSDALQQLLADKVWVYSTDSPVAAYYTVQHPDQFELVNQILEPALEGIALPCTLPSGVTDCTKGSLSPVGTAVETALKSMMADGTYTKILEKWNLASGAVKP